MPCREPIRQSGPNPATKTGSRPWPTPRPDSLTPRRSLLARQQPVALGRLPGERRQHGRVPLHALRLDPLVHVHVGVMGAGAVLDRVLDELEAGQSYIVKRQVVSATDVADRKDLHAAILEQPHTDDKEWTDSQV